MRNPGAPAKDLRLVGRVRSAVAHLRSGPFDFARVSGVLVVASNDTGPSDLLGAEQNGQPVERFTVTGSQICERNRPDDSGR